MFGKIISIENNAVILANETKTIDTNLIGFHVAFAEQSRTIIGEIISINPNEIKIFLTGEIVSNIFIPEVVVKPSFKTIPRLITGQELELVLGKQDFYEEQTLLIGNCVTYEKHLVTTEIKEFFDSHFAMMGNTGSGKSCGLARILQNLFYYKPFLS